MNHECHENNCLFNRGDLMIPVVQESSRVNRSISLLPYEYWHTGEELDANFPSLKIMGKDMANFFFTNASGAFVDPFFEQYDRRRKGG